MTIYNNSETGKVLKWYPKKFLVNMLTLTGILVGIWFAISFLQVLCHQGDSLKLGVSYTYPTWNIFVWIGDHVQWLFR